MLENQPEQLVDAKRSLFNKDNTTHKKFDFDPKTASYIESLMEKRRLHRSEVSYRKKSQQNLEKLAHFIQTLLNSTATRIDETLGDIVDEQELIRLAIDLGATEEDVKNVIFQSNYNRQNQNLIQRLKDTRASIASSQRRKYNMGIEIVNVCERLFSGKPGLNRLLSTEKNIPVSRQKSDGVETRMMSNRDLFVNNLDSLVLRMAAVEQAVVEASLVDPDMATYNAYDWVKNISSQVVSQRLKVFPTPSTELTMRQIEVAHTKRNGLLTYILFGEAGTGKTRLAQETDKSRGKNTIVINFHHFLAFEDLIGQTAIAVDLGGQSSLDRLDRAVERFVDSNQDEEAFWVDMDAIYMHLSNEQRQKYANVEAMVANFDQGLATQIPESNITNDRLAVRKAFLRKLKAIRDMALMGFQAGGGDIQARWVQGVIMKAITEGKGDTVVCFDEMDKAGQHSIEGLLSFLSLEAGDTWKFQGGSVQIPAGFYCTATSNSSSIGGVTGSMEMNRYLADRCEQIEVRPQPIKDSLMIAAVNLSDEDGTLLINEEDQQYLIMAFSYIVPKLQEAGLSMPVTNRVIRTISSRLVNYLEKDGQRRYFRVLDSSGGLQSVAEALRLSVFEMKKLSLTPDDAKKVSAILTAYQSLLGEGKVKSLVDDLIGFDLPLASDRQAELNRRLAVIESVWEQPLFRAIAALESDMIPFNRPKPQQILTSMLGDVDLTKFANSSATLEAKAYGRRNGVILETSKSGINMNIATANGVNLGSKEILTGDYSDMTIPLADELGETFVIMSADGYKLVKEGKIVREKTRNEEKIVAIDPKGKYFVATLESGLVIMTIDKLKAEVEEKIGVYETIEFLSLPVGVTLVDISNNGDRLLVRDGECIKLIEVHDAITHGTEPLVYDLSNQQWENAKFIGNHMIVGLDQTGAVITSAEQEGQVILISS